MEYFDSLIDYGRDSKQQESFSYTGTFAKQPKPNLKPDRKPKKSKSKSNFPTNSQIGKSIKNQSIMTTQLPTATKITPAKQSQHSMKRMRSSKNSRSRIGSKSKKKLPVKSQTQAAMESQYYQNCNSILSEYQR
jgi:hypothetical protein